LEKNRRVRVRPTVAGPDTIDFYVRRADQWAARNTSGNLEQVQVRGMNRRSLRLKLVAGLGMALTLPLVAASAQSVSTQTSMSVTTNDQNGQTKSTVLVNVAGADGTQASGAVSILDGTQLLRQVALNSAGQATSVLTLPGGEHNLRAVYNGDSSHLSSTSVSTQVQAQASTTAGFELTLAAVSPSTLPLVLTAGNAGTVNVTVVPVNPTALTSPMFVTLSCSGLPNQSSCSFTPETVQILSTTPTSCASGSAAADCPPVSTLVLQTQASGTASLRPSPAAVHGNGPVAWAILLPGVLGLGGLAWGARRRAWLSRFAMLALVALVTVMGATACNPRYDYYHHGPQTNLPTPSGSYTITVTGQTSNGITAITQNTTFVLTVE
jgi:hypothetical protein